jgi:hypothetical protein
MRWRSNRSDRWLWRRSRYSFRSHLQICARESRRRDGIGGRQSNCRKNRSVLAPNLASQIILTWRIVNAIETAMTTRPAGIKPSNLIGDGKNGLVREVSCTRPARGAWCTAPCHLEQGACTPRLAFINGVRHRAYIKVREVERREFPEAVCMRPVPDGAQSGRVGDRDDLVQIGLVAEHAAHVVGVERVEGYVHCRACQGCTECDDGCSCSTVVSDSRVDSIYPGARRRRPVDEFHSPSLDLACITPDCAARYKQTRCWPSGHVGRDGLVAHFGRDRLATANGCLFVILPSNNTSR